MIKNILSWAVKCYSCYSSTVMSVQSLMLRFCFLAGVSVSDPTIVPHVPLQTLLSDWCVSALPSPCLRAHLAFSTVWNVSFALSSLSISAHLSFSIACQQERKHGRRLTEQTRCILGWAPMSYVSFSCCIVLPFPAAICTHGPEQTKLCSNLLRILWTLLT